MAIRRVVAAPDADPSDESLGRVLLRVTREMRTLFDRVLEPLGITAQQAELLHRCSRERELSMQQLTRLLMTDGAGVTRLVDRLEAKGLLSRRTNRRDRRAVTLQLTAAGRSLIPRVARLAEAQKRRLFAGLSPSDERQTRALLYRVLANARERHA